MMKTIAFALLSTLILTGIAPTRAVAESQLKKLQGTWVGIESDGQREGESTLEIVGDKISFVGFRQGEWYKGTVELGQKDGVLQIFGTVRDCPIPELVGKTSNGIYTLEDNTLTIVARAPGDPAEPTGMDDPDCRKMTLKLRK